MTEIGFYHLTRSPLEQALPRLLEKVLASGQRAVLRCPDRARMEALDRALWTYGKDSFLPHGTRADGFAEAQPIFLTDIFTWLAFFVISAVALYSVGSQVLPALAPAR